jgi:uncharacterized protein (TIGR02391 family)
MPVPISTLIPSLPDLLALPIEELAGVLLVHLNSYVYGGNAIAQNGKLNQSEFFSWLWKNPPYPGNSQQVIQDVLLEAWNLLENEGLLARTLDSASCWFFVTRRGKTIKSRDDFASYRKGNLLPKHQIHPVIANEVYSIFLGGKYDTAIFEAFRQVEMGVRHAAYPEGTEYHGLDLMRAAFKPAEKKGAATTPGVLTDPQLPVAEQEAMANLFAGAFGVYRNSTGHRNIGTAAEEAAEVIIFASLLLRIVDAQRFRMLHDMPPPVDDLEPTSGE